MAINANTHVITICNSALIKLGGKMIADLNASSKEARLCKEQYPKVKRMLLRSHPWNFAIKRTQLGLLVDKPVFQFENKFALPSDCLRVLTTSIDSGDFDYRIEGVNLVTDQGEVSIRYISDVDESFFDENFSEVLAMKLALDLSYAIVQSGQTRDGLLGEYKAMLAEARSFDAQEGKPEEVLGEGEGLFLNARF